MKKNLSEIYDIGNKVGTYGIWKGSIRGKYDIRNKVNNLTGKEWIKNTASVWEYEENHRVNLCKDIIRMFTSNKLNNDILVINDNLKIIDELFVNEVYSSLQESKPSFTIKKFKSYSLDLVNENDKYQLTLSFINDSILSYCSNLTVTDKIQEYIKWLNIEEQSLPNTLYPLTQEDRYSVVVLNEFSVNGLKISTSDKIIESFQNVGFEYRGKITSFDKKSLSQIKNLTDSYGIIDIHSYILVFYKPKTKINIIRKPKLELTNIVHKNSVALKSELIPSILYSKTKTDEIGKIHPATFSYIDVEYLINKFIGKNKNKIIFDPFLGVASTIIAADLTNNIGLGIELNPDYISLSQKRLKQMNINNYITSYKNERILIDQKKFHYLLEGNSVNRINQEDIPMFDYCITSPPYHNILRNSGNGVRSDNSQFRQGVQYYSEMDNDLGNQNSLEEYFELYSKVMTATFKKLKNNGYCSIIISDFTVNKKEVDISGKIVQLMSNIGYKYIGTIILVQSQKVIYPFGYPYKFVLNHVNQFVINFRK